VRYGFFNILADDEVRQGLKEYADWPTFPQLWVDGELVGGLDIVSRSEPFLIHGTNGLAGQGRVRERPRISNPILRHPHNCKGLAP
jgi:hypothetical protein